MPSKFITPGMTLVNQQKTFKILIFFSSFATLIAYVVSRACWYPAPLPVIEEAMLLVRLFSLSSLLSILLFSLFLLFHFVYKRWVSRLFVILHTTGFQLFSYAGNRIYPKICNLFPVRNVFIFLSAGLSAISVRKSSEGMEQR